MKAKKFIEAVKVAETCKDNANVCYEIRLTIRPTYPVNVKLNPPYDLPCVILELDEEDISSLKDKYLDLLKVEEDIELERLKKEYNDLRQIKEEEKTK